MSGAWSISWLYQPLFSGASPANTTSGRWARTAAGSAVINCVTPGPHVTLATPTSQFFREYAMAAARAQCSRLSAGGCRMVYVRHEHCALAAAMAYSRKNWDVGVASGTCGAGGAQFITGLPARARGQP